MENIFFFFYPLVPSFSLCVWEPELERQSFNQVAIKRQEHMSQGQVALLRVCVSVFYIVLTTPDLRQVVLGQQFVT